ncbi:MAG TPA: EamA family transporter [Candidatus Dormibacteraeota bacterium]|nr:EamA family transporter [Candidatus Dormibacteraeota bacterium]
MSLAARSVEAPSLPRAGASPLAVGLALAGVYVIWGSTYLGIRVTLETMPPLLMGAFRFLVAGSLLFAWSARRGPWRQDRLGWRQWLGTFLVGAALLFMGNGGVILAERTVPSGVVALVIATVPLWMALIARVGFGQRLRPLAILGLALGFGGVALLLESPGSGAIDPLGAAIAVVAPVFWALGSVYSRRVSLPTRPLVATAMQMLCAGGLYLVAGVAAGELGRVHLSRVSGASALALVYLIIFGSLVGYSAYTWLLRVAPLSLVSTYAYVNPIVAVTLGWLILAEPVTIRTLLAGAIIVTAVALIVTARFRPAAPVRP